MRPGVYWGNKTYGLSTRYFKYLIKKSMFILMLHGGDYVFILMVYSWPLAGGVT